MLNISEIVNDSINEDAPNGDITSLSLIPADAKISGTLTAREGGIFCGEEIIAEITRQIDDYTIDLLIADGKPFTAGTILANITGNARSVLQAERLLLNFIQRLCAIATLTSRFVELTKGTKAKIYDTRKTTPLLRQIERHAVVCGGGLNHRYSLSDAILIKDNHLAIASSSGINLNDALQALPRNHTIEVEVDRLNQIEPILASEVVDIIMLDNFTLDDMRTAITLIDGRAIVEASGGISLETASAVAATGVDRISIGALTHGVHSLDIGLDTQ